MDGWMDGWMDGSLLDANRCLEADVLSASDAIGYCNS
jgi:hypothetical protein